MSITERAKNLTDWILRRDGMLKHAGLQELIERELKEQDEISRKEERANCTKLAIEFYCKNCGYYHSCKQSDGAIMIDCDTPCEIREYMNGC